LAAEKSAKLFLYPVIGRFLNKISEDVGGCLKVFPYMNLKRHSDEREELVLVSYKHVRSSYLDMAMKS
jgi:hypothetical protein